MSTVNEEVWNEAINTERENIKNDGDERSGKYVARFSNVSPAWNNEMDYNMYFLIQQQHFANEKLKAVGTIFLNDVHVMCGLPITEEGEIAGWRYKPGNLSYISFGISQPTKKGDILLDFNCEDNVLDYLE